MGSLAQSRPNFIDRLAHYLEQFHPRYQKHSALEAKALAGGMRNWTGLLRNRKDNPYHFDNPELPALQPWINTTSSPAYRFIFRRNPYYHWVDLEGYQLHYIARVVMNITNKGLIAAKTSARKSDLQSRYLRLDNLRFLNRRKTGLAMLSVHGGSAKSRI